MEFACLCFSVSPDQKREMVNLIKEGVPGVRTLSVGDGANDVAMIQVDYDILKLLSARIYVLF